MSERFENHQDDAERLKSNLAKPSTSPDQDHAGDDLMAHLEERMDELNQPEKVEVKEAEEVPSNEPEKAEAKKSTPPNNPEQSTETPPKSNRNRPENLSSALAMTNVVEQLGLAADRTSLLVTQILEGRLTTADRNRFAKKGPQEAAAVQITAQIEAELGRLTGNASQILAQAKRLNQGQATEVSGSLMEQDVRQVAEQLRKGLASEQALAYVQVDQMAQALVNGLEQSGVRLG